jgi:two-component system, LytTR family, response regulator
MIRAVHIEDEPGNIELLASLLDKCCKDTIALEGSARTLPDAVTLIRNKKPQLVFLDIELNQGNGFDLLAQLQPIDFEVIFITAFNEYAVKAFRANALDYLLKPISISELTDAVSKAVKKIGLPQKNTSGIDNLLNDLRPADAAKKISIPMSDGVIFIQTDDIVRIEAKGSYSIIYLISGKVITCTKNLKFMELQLPEQTFLRVHHSWIIHLKYLKKYFRGKNGYMEMEDGSKVMVSVRKKGKFLDAL